MWINELYVYIIRIIDNCKINCFYSFHVFFCIAHLLLIVAWHGLQQLRDNRGTVCSISSPNVFRPSLHVDEIFTRWYAKLPKYQGAIIYDLKEDCFLPHRVLGSLGPADIARKSDMKSQLVHSILDLKGWNANWNIESMFWNPKTGVSYTESGVWNPESGCQERKN